MAVKRRGRGRPKAETGTKRTDVISVRLLPEERAAIERAAGPIPVSIWARIALVAAAEQAAPVAPPKKRRVQK